MGAHLRPTPDRVRESLFSMLMHRNVIEGARVLDLFAGSGALAFEALSRGAQSAVLVENGRTAQRLVTENIRTLDAQDAHLLRIDATRAQRIEGGPFDLVFLDPPYGKGLGQKALEAVQDLIAPGALIVWEEEMPESAQDGYVFDSTKKFGTVHVTFLTRT